MHTVESIVLSIISMLSCPNDESPANIDAAKMWREDREAFKKKVARIVRKSQEMVRLHNCRFYIMSVLICVVCSGEN